MNNFEERVLRVVKTISKGRVLTYKEVARRAGSPKASRAVGNILKKNYSASTPCHRVIHSDGTIGEYNRGAKKKIMMLRGEGVKMVKNNNGYVIHKAE
ncbi:MAG TPA: MGMT family protein [Candidatus Paceibacterota bacterium]